MGCPTCGGFWDGVGWGSGGYNGLARGLSSSSQRTCHMCVNGLARAVTAGQAFRDWINTTCHFGCGVVRRTPGIACRAME